MSQLPPADPYGQVPPQQYAPQTPVGPAPYSALAIAGFICALLGFCLGVPAILGLILGIAGVAVTRGGLRRGRGLAIAAIPISLVATIVWVVIGMVFMAFSHLAQSMEQVTKLYDVNGHVSVSAAQAIRDSFTDEFKQQVSEEQFIAWLERVRADEGAFIQITDPGEPAPDPKHPDRLILHSKAKFATGTKTIDTTIQMDSLTSWGIADVSVDGLSPRNLPPEKPGKSDVPDKKAVP